MNPHPPRPKANRRLAIGLLLAGTFGAAAAVPAHADYTVDVCRHADGSAAPTDGWTRSGAGAVDTCATGGALSIVESGAASPSTPVTITGPAVYSSKIWRTLQVTQSPNGSGTPWTMLRDDKIVSYSLPGFGNAAEPLNPSNLDSTSAPYNAAPSFTMRCATYQCPDTARLSIWRASESVSDGAPPQLVGLSGPLAAATTPDKGAPIVVSGHVSLTAHATDPGSGVRDLRLTVDPVGTVSLQALAPDPDGHCTPVGNPADHVFSWLHPCPADTSITLDWDTTKVPDGIHHLWGTMIDAAGNATNAIYEGEVLVRNGGTVGPGTPDMLRGPTNGIPADDAPSFALRWAGSSTRPGGVATTDRPYSRTATDELKGTITATTHRLAMENAQIDVSTQLHSADAPEVPLTTVKSTANGHFTIAIPRKLGTVDVILRYRAHLADTVTHDATAVRRTSATTTISAPRRAARGARITFSGTLAPIVGNPNRVPISLQVLSGGKWRTFATSQTDGKGHWSRRISFARTPGSYRVRAKTGLSVAYPFSSGVSKPATIRVR